MPRRGNRSLVREYAAPGGQVGRDGPTPGAAQRPGCRAGAGQRATPQGARGASSRAGECGRNPSRPCRRSAPDVKADVTKNRLVLVVRADPVVDRCLGDFLTARGYTPVRTSTFEEALAAVTHNLFLFSVVDLDGTEGLEFLQHLKAKGGPAGPIIVLARGSRIAETLGTLSLPADHVVQKPFTTHDLEDAVDHALGCGRRGRRTIPVRGCSRNWPSGAVSRCARCATSS